MPKVPASHPATVPPRIRRAYFECRYGQLHVHNAIPSGGGFEEGTALLCLHQSPHSGGSFARFLALTGAGRSVFSPDLPGFGDSDPPTTPGAGVAEHAAAIGDFLDVMRLRQIDLLGHRFGALVATELATTRPAQVRRMVLVSPPLSQETVEPQPSAPGADGSQLLDEWRRTMAYLGPDAPPEAATAVLAERLRNSAQAAAATTASRGYPLRAKLAQLSAPLLIVRLREEVVANRGQARDLPGRARLIELPEQGASLFETAPEAAAQALEAFLR